VYRYTAASLAQVPEDGGGDIEFSGEDVQIK
jgi:hypothetical protein